MNIIAIAVLRLATLVLFSCILSRFCSIFYSGHQMSAHRICHSSFTFTFLGWGLLFACFFLTRVSWQHKIRDFRACGTCVYYCKNKNWFQNAGHPGLSTIGQCDVKAWTLNATTRAFSSLRVLELIRSTVMWGVGRKERDNAASKCTVSRSICGDS